MERINNDFYETLGERWYTDSCHPIAFLREENRFRLPWLLERLPPGAKLLDVGCGAGFLANPLAAHGFHVTGLDASPASLAVARRFDTSQRVTYVEGRAEEIPFPESFFDVVLAMDLLEHVEEPARVIQEAARVLKPGGLLFFHTFNKTFSSYLLAVKAIALFFKDAPRDIHLYRLFLEPATLDELCKSASLDVQEMVGMRPVIFQRALWKLLFQRRVSDDFAFTFTKSLRTGYLGRAQKRSSW